MKFAMTKIAASLALLALASGAQAAAVTSMTLADTINAAGTTSLADDTLGSDGFSGAFRFSAINLGTYAGASLFSGDLNGGVINMAGSSPEAANPAGAFTSGFIFATQTFDPFNNGAITADITGGVLTFSDFNFAGLFGGVGGPVFDLPPDAGTLTVQNLIATGPDTYAYRITWSHVITDAEDPSGEYVDFNARWVLEGMMSTATAPIPEASTYGMMLAGLGLVGFAVRRRKLMA